MEFIGTGERLTDDDVRSLAEKWDVEEEIIHAVDEVESAGVGFLSDKRPKILYEAHVFWRLTNGLYGQSNISWPVWNKSLYGKSGAHQYDRLHQAVQLNRSAALQSASWGRYQVLGNNWRDLKYESPEQFVQEMMKGEAEQLEAFARFCEKNNLVQFLVDKNWPRFARRYNGPGQVDYYVEKLVAAYEKWKDKNLDPGVEVETQTQAPGRKVIRFGFKGEEVEYLQSKLELKIDGEFGPVTLRRVREFQIEKGLKSDGIVGKMTWKEIDEMEKDEDNG